MEERNKATPESIMAKIKSLAFVADADFAKYNAMSLAQSLVYCSQDSAHKKANYYAAALQEIRARLHKPAHEFKAYFLALFADSDYSKVLESIAKVEKSPHQSPSTGNKASRPRQVTCYKCGRQGHFANRCRARPYTSLPRKADTAGPKPLFQ